jgi:hypothetical protein
MKKNKRKSKESTLSEYLSQESLSDEYHLTANGSLKFHWSNWSKSCFIQKDNFNDNSNLKRFNNLEEEMNSLKTQDIFLKRGEKVVKSNLYDMYTSFLDPKIRMAWDDLFGDFLISLKSTAGPFFSLSSMRWFDKNIYKTFVYKKIIQGNVNFRNLRLGVSIPVDCFFDHSPFKTAEFLIEQISKEGLIIKINGAHNISKIDLSKEFCLKMNLKLFEESVNLDVVGIIKKFSNTTSRKNKDLEKINFSVSSKIMNKYNNRNNAKFASGENYYLYIRYSDLEPIDTEFDFQLAFEQFIYKFEKYFEEELLDSSKISEAA